MANCGQCRSLLWDQGPAHTDELIECGGGAMKKNWSDDLIGDYAADSSSHEGVVTVLSRARVCLQ
jgi:hypothetical protein